MTIRLVCECGYETDDGAGTIGAEHRCPRCGRRIFADEAEADADFDRLDSIGIGANIAHTVTLAVAPAAPLVPKTEDPDVTLDISDIKKPTVQGGNDEPTQDIADFVTQIQEPAAGTDKKPKAAAQHRPMAAAAFSGGNPFANQSPPPQIKENPPSQVPRGSRVNLSDRVMRPILKPSVPSGSHSQEGNYGFHRVIRVHQKGGMGRIVVAYDQYLKREVALKELHAEVSGDDSIVRRFVGEAEITAQLEHPGVVPVHYLGLDNNGLPYYTMKMVRGETLQEAIREYHRKPARNTLLVLIRRLVSASKTIAFAHSKGVIHRDLKPANIMVGEHGETLVMDWGLAKPFMQNDETYISTISRGGKAGQADLTMIGAIVGTPAFMSPEQAAADDAMIGPLSDVFALGTVLYYLLAGQTAFSGRSTQEVLNKVRAANPVRPSSLKANVPHGLESICFKAMAKEPHNRYQGAQEFVDDLCRWLDNEPISAVKETLWQSCGRWIAKRKRLAISVPFIAVLMTLLTYAGIQIGYHSTAKAQQEVIDTILNKSEDLLEFPEFVSVEGSQGMTAVRGVRQSNGGTILTCQIDTETKEKRRIVIIRSPEGLAWDVTDRSALTFSLFEGQAEDTEALQNFSVRLGRGSSYYEYKPGGDIWNNRRRSNWYTFVVPLSVPDSHWEKTVSGVPSMNKIEWVELHFDVLKPTVISFDHIKFLNDAE
ncbi:MAG: serine/threonine protein kinase [Planctomycetaceae bacterium]|jgi:serine/threonine protein kinase|nr:serine/threonine protein kinase [Planctomycetaceae bacterium]